MKLFYQDHKTRNSGRNEHVKWPIPFLVLVDWIFVKIIGKRTGIRLNLYNYLEDLEFEDDICQITEQAKHLQGKIGKLTQYPDAVGQKIIISSSTLDGK